MIMTHVFLLAHLITYFCVLDRWTMLFSSKDRVIADPVITNESS